jgi:trans-aconitate 2-methyltransferase
VEAWETTYLQVLQGQDAVVRWMRGTGLRPVLAELDAGEQEEFLSAYRERMRAAYPPEPSGTVLPYRRVFVVAEVAGPR